MLLCGELEDEVVGTWIETSRSVCEFYARDKCYKDASKIPFSDSTALAK